MELLADHFSSSFSVSSDPNDTAAPHPRLGQHKVKPLNVPDQSVRRQRMLEQQKKRRSDFVNYARKLVDGNLQEEDLEAPESEEMDAASCESYKTRRKRFNPYAYQLMLSEWMVEVPEDLAEEWSMVICPIGKRNLIIAANGATSTYTKSGFRVNRFTSLLPGGSPQTLKPGEYTILDCIFSEVTNTFYILDIMCWRGHPVFDSETEFRFYWLQTKLEENPALAELSSTNPYKYVGLSCYACTTEILATAIGSPSFQVDGLLFYHKRTHYTQGRTPLVGWLKPYMLPAILGIPVAPEIMASAPLVNKLTLLEANKDLRNTTDDKTALEKSELSNSKESCEKMETEQRKKKGRRRKTTDKTGSEENDPSTETSDSPQSMDVDRKTQRRRRRSKGKKKTEEEMTVECEEKSENSEERVMTRVTP